MKTIDAQREILDAMNYELFGDTPRESYEMIEEYYPDPETTIIEIIPFEDPF